MFSTTRHGGVSSGEYASFNINEYCGDTAENIAANRKALCDELGIDEAHLVMPHQTHGVEVRQIAADFIALPENIRRMILEGVDAVMTNESGICIGVSTADCIPVLIYDKAHHAVCAVHAGWRGTVARIVEKAVKAMALAYGTEPQDLQCAIGPGISLDAFEVGTDIDGPAQRAYADFQLAFELVEDVKRVAPFAVQLIDENHHRRFAHTAHFHQFASLLLHTFRHVDHDDNAVHGSQSAVGVFGEILVTGSVEDIDFVVAVVKPHHRGSHRDAALLLDFHPVGSSGFFYFVRLYGTCHMDCSTKEEEFFGECCFTCVGVTDDGECAPFLYFFF